LKETALTLCIQNERERERRNWRESIRGEINFERGTDFVLFRRMPGNACPSF
jgi:hypothetical protein